MSHSGKLCCGVRGLHGNSSCCSSKTSHYTDCNGCLSDVAIPDCIHPCQPEQQLFLESLSQTKLEIELHCTLQQPLLETLFLRLKLSLQGRCQIVKPFLILTQSSTAYFYLQLLEFCSQLQIYRYLSNCLFTLIFPTHSCTFLTPYHTAGT